MFFFRKKKKKEAEKAPVWFAWLMVGFVVYAIFTNLFTDNVAEVQQKSLPKDIDYFKFSIVRTTGPGVTPRPLYMHDVKIGSGEMASCWFNTTVHYKLYNDKGELVEDTRDSEPVSFVLGKHQVPMALERGTFGIRVGGKRAVTAQPKMLFGGADGFEHEGMTMNDFGGYIIDLQGIERPMQLPFSDLGLRIYDDKVGEGSLAQCTDRVRLRIRGWNVLGEPLWDDLNLPAIMVDLGAGVAPYAVERGTLEMKVGGVRTLIVPAGYMEPLFSQKTEEKLKKLLSGESVDEPLEEAATEEEPLSVVEAQEKAFLDKVRGVSDEKDNFPWENLPLPQDEVIILELELLPENVTMPKLPGQSN